MTKLTTLIYFVGETHVAVLVVVKIVATLEAVMIHGDQTDIFPYCILVVKLYL